MRALSVGGFAVQSAWSILGILLVGSARGTEQWSPGARRRRRTIAAVAATG